MTMYRSQVIDSQLLSLSTVDTASGAIATFDTDLTENLVDVKCQIVAKQASGTPSPDNPLPIGVYDSLTLYHNDINMWNEQWEVGALISDGTVDSSLTLRRTTSFIKINPNTQYYLPMACLNGRYAYYDETKTLIAYNGNGFVTYINTTPNNAYYLRVTLNSNYGTTYNHDISINYPSTDTQYHAFNGAYIPFGQTVANGVLDITTGKLRITDGYATFDGSESWSAYSTFNYHYQITLSNVLKNEDQNKNSYSSHFTSRARMSNNAVSITEGVFSADANRIRFKNVDCADLTEWISFVTTQYNNGTPVQVVYKLATPIEIQLDSITLQALLNENNIWCDTNGDTEVKFWMSINKYIGQ